MLRGGNVPLHEPGLDDLIRRNRNRLRFTLDLEEMFAETRLAFICVDTPPMPSGDADLSRVQAVIDAIPPSAEGAGLVMKSTVPVGTGEHVRVRLDARGLHGVVVHVEPRVPPRGLGGERLHGARPGRRRRRRRTRTPSASRASTTASTRRSCAPTSPRRR